MLGLSSGMKGGPLLTDRIAEATVLGMLMGRYQHLELRGKPDPHVRFFWLSLAVCGIQFPEQDLALCPQQ